MSKKIGAFLVVAFMLCSFISTAAFASEGEPENGYTIKYDICTVCEEGYATSDQTAKTQSKSFSSITYGATKGFFEFHSSMEGNTPIWTNLMYRNGVFQMTYKRWIAFKINVPVAGTYDVNVEFSKYKAGTDLYTFILPEDANVKTEVNKDTSSIYYVGLVNTLDASRNSPGTKPFDNASVGTWTFTQAGTYILAYKTPGLNSADYTFPGTLTLSSGTNTFAMSVVASVDNSEIKSGKTAQVTVNSVTMSDTTAGNVSDCNYEYTSSNADVAVVSQEGLVTAKSAGNCKIGVRAVADGVENKYSEIPITVTDPNPNPVIANDNIQVYIGAENAPASLVASSINVGNVVNVARGTTVTATAASQDGYIFRYWINKNTKRVITTENELAINPVMSIGVTAVFSRDSDGTLVDFFSDNGIRIQSGYVAKDAPVSAPANQSKFGYSGNGVWNVGSDAISGVGYKSFTPDFSAATAVKYAVTDRGELEYNSEVTVSANAESGGNAFSYWTKNGKIVSYNRDYTFYVFNAETLNAIYNGEVTEKYPGVVLFNNGSTYMLELVNCDSVTVLEKGILFSTVGTPSVSSYTSRAVSHTDLLQFSAEGDGTARAYVIYLDGSQTRVAYSD